MGLVQSPLLCKQPEHGKRFEVCAAGRGNGGRFVDVESQIIELIQERENHAGIDDSGHLLDCFMHATASLATNVGECGFSETDVTVVGEPDTGVDVSRQVFVPVLDVTLLVHRQAVDDLLCASRQVLEPERALAVEGRRGSAQGQGLPALTANDRSG